MLEPMLERTVRWRSWRRRRASPAPRARVAHYATRMARCILALLGIVTACALGAAGPAAGQAGTVLPQHRLVAASHGVSVQANLFTYCRLIDSPLEDRGICVDGRPGATATSVPVHGGGDVTIVTGVPVYEIAAAFANLDGSGGSRLPVRALDTSGRNFAVVLPPGAPFPLLLVSTRYRNVSGDGGRTNESGDAHFSVSLSEHRHGKVRPTHVTAFPRIRCGPPRNGRRSCRLRQRGSVGLPERTSADCRGGRVLVRVAARRRGLVVTRVPTRADCRYRFRSPRFSLPPGVNRVVVRTRFLGGSSTRSRSTRPIRIRLRFN